VDGFDIGRITDADFEALCRDLLGQVLGVRFEIFASGKDGGVDLRYVGPSGETWIVQCKHWAGSGRATLLAHMAGKEKSKVDLLKPDRYLLATSVDLNPAAKDRLFADLAPWVRDTGDLWGVRELVEELRTRDDVVRRHIRLWLNSAAVLQAMLDNGIRTRTQMLAADIDVTLLTYVPNASLGRAWELLDERHVCIISGAPGVGKTTLAQVLAATHVAEGFELVEVSEDVEEAFTAWREGHYQIFYYDDFLGQTALEDKLRKNEESRLLRLLSHVRRDPQKRIILTTRAYILEQARQRYERLGREDFDPLTCIVDLSDYSIDIRAQILYNHVYFADLSNAQKASFVDPAAHLPILRHRNFNPRLVALTFAMISPEIVPEMVPAEVSRSLDDPRRLWAHLVENQLAPSQVTLLQAIYSVGAANIGPLRTAWQSLAGARDEHFPEDEFRKSLSVLDGTLVQIFDRDGVVRIVVANPSINDFMADYLAHRPDALAALLRSAIYYEQVRSLWPRLQVDKHAHLRLMVEHKIMDLLYAEPLSGSLPNSMPDRLLTALHVADLFGDEAFRIGVLEELASDVTGLVNYCGDLYTLVGLVQHLRASDDEEAGEVLEEIEEAICERLTWNLEEDWESARAAQEAVAELGIDISDRLAEEIDTAIVAGAVKMVERWRSGDQSVATREDLSEILASADAHYVESLIYQSGDEGDSANPTRALHNWIALTEDHALYWHRNSPLGQSDRMAEETATSILSGLAAFAQWESRLA